MQSAEMMAAPPGVLRRKLAMAGALLRQGEYARFFDRVSDHVLPTGNPVFYWDRFLIVELDPHGASGLEGAGPPKAVFARQDDIDELCASTPERAAVFRRRVAAGQECVVIREGGRITARLWLMRDHAAFPSNSGMNFSPHGLPSLWCHDIFVDPAYRRRGHFAAMMREAAHSARGRRPRLYAEIHHLNRASIEAHRRFGFRPVREVLVLSILGLKLYFIRDEEGRLSIEHRYALRLDHN